MEPFAGVDDLYAGWPGHPELDEAVAQTLLLRSSLYLSALLRRRGVAVDADDQEQAQALCAVCCSMTRRSLTAGPLEGVASMAQTIGATTASLQPSNPDGALYVTKAERELLGVAGRGAYRAVLARTAFDAEEA